jgi:endonuclease/exonuclease/phosphatase family metal-dependent hydrolase
MIAAKGAAPMRRTLRVMTYNVHSCVGLDGKLSPHRIARVIARYEPDVVALQEVDVGRLRTEGTDQADVIATYLNMEYHFHPAMCVEEELYGDCILSRVPMKVAKMGALPTMSGRDDLEPRGALWVALEYAGTKVQLLNTHLGLKRREKLAQMSALLGEGWIGANRTNEPVIVCGDFNAMPTSAVCRLCRERFRDVQVDGTASPPRATWFGNYPIARIDHIFVSQRIEVVHVEVGNDYLARVASDHRPLLADLHILS